MADTIPNPPANRRLRVYSIDPSADVALTTAGISRCVLEVPWEKLERGPRGAYVEVVDVDPASNCAYDPVDLEHANLLAQDGLQPSEGNPQFHQQMVYAVTMKTIANFELALGRRVLWSERKKDEQGKLIFNREERYVPQLRVYPHALRERNAYYSPERKALLFGYFNATTTDPREELPGGTVFSCLSHDIVAHETTHAILDGVNSRLLEITNGDMLALHEAFADIVAIFQHFTLPGVVLDQIRQMRGNLGAHDNLLSALAIQFGRATGMGQALRSALGDLEEGGRRKLPDPTVLANTTEPHDRGAILVAAVFDAFLRIYEDRVRDLRVIATGGTGVLPDGEIHPALVARFADEAVRVAQRVLTICIRALDYLPPVDITFGDYLRALITADAELVPDDPHRYRLAFIDAFRQRGIYPRDVRSLGEDSLRWKQLDAHEWQSLSRILPPANVMRMMVSVWTFSADAGLMDEETAEALKELKKSRKLDDMAERFLRGYQSLCAGASSYSLSDQRQNDFLLEGQFAQMFQRWIVGKALELQADEDARRAIDWHLGLNLERLLAAVEQGKAAKDGRLEVRSVRPILRNRPGGLPKLELLVILQQKLLQELDGSDAPQAASDAASKTQFKYRGGCTLVIDPVAGCARYAITKRAAETDRPGSDAPNNRLERIRVFLQRKLHDLGQAALDRFPLVRSDGPRDGRSPVEPLRIVHRRRDPGE
jgi:hypothetical protein